MRKYVLAIFLLVPLLTGVAVAQEQQPEDIETALVRLTVAVERMVTLLEHREALEVAESNRRQVAVAVDILGLRYRKIEQIEHRIQQISKQEDYFPQTLQVMRSEIERLEIDGRAESGEIEAWARNEIEMNEQRLKLEAERQRRMREQKLLLEDDLVREQRRLTSVEALLDEWLDSL